MSETIKYTDYDKTQFYEERIAPLVQKLCDVCYEGDVPMFFSACVANKDGKSEYKREEVSPDDRKLILYDNQLNRHLCVACGFDVISRIKYDVDPSVEKALLDADEEEI